MNGLYFNLGLSNICDHDKDCSVSVLLFSISVVRAIICGHHIQHKRISSKPTLRIYHCIHDC